MRHILSKDAPEQPLQRTKQDRCQEAVFLNKRIEERKERLDHLTCQLRRKRAENAELIIEQQQDTSSTDTDATTDVKDLNAIHISRSRILDKEYHE